MSTSLYSGVSGLALGVGLYKGVPGLWGGASGLISGPNASLSLDFVTSNTLDSRITFSRTSNATLVDATGKLTYAPNNLVTYSEQFEAWTKVASTIAPNTTVAPNNTTTADKLVEDTSVTTGHFVQPVSSGGLIAGQFVIYSVYAKAGERTFVQIILTGAGPAGVNVVAGFDLINGTAGTPSATTTSTITSVGNGWYRCSIAVPVATTVSSSLQIRLALNSTATPSSYTGDGVSGLFIWGAQLEQVTYQTAPSTYVQTVASAYYGPRFDYNPVTLAPKGLLIEEQRVNSLLYSDQFDQATWTKAGATISPNITVSPDGTSNADKLVEDSTTGQHRFFRTATGTTNTNAYTVSFFAKAAERTRIYVGVAETPTFVRQGNAVFDLSTGTVVNASAGSGGASGGSATIQAFPNGWYRCTYTLTLGGTDTSIFTDINLVSTGTTISYAGNGVSGAFVYGAQLEAGAFATSYIPTVASTVTRAADIVTMTGTNFSSWYNQTEGTFVLSGDVVSNSGNRVWMDVGPNGAFGTTAYVSQTSTNINLQPTTAPVNIGSSVATTALSNTIAIGLQTNNSVIAVGGVLGSVDTSCTMPASATQLVIGSAIWNLSGNIILDGHIRRITYYPTRLTNAQLQALTA